MRKLNIPKTVELHPLVKHLLYGDIEEMSLEILKNECPSAKDYDKMDIEQSIRLSAAASVQAWIEQRLHKNGYIWDKTKHKQEDLISI